MNLEIVKTRFMEFWNVSDLRWEIYRAVEDEFFNEAFQNTRKSSIENFFPLFILCEIDCVNWRENIFKPGVKRVAVTNCKNGPIWLETLDIRVGKPWFKLTSSSEVGDSDFDSHS